MTTRLASRSLLTILGSIIVAWVLVLLAAYADLFVTPVYDDGVFVGESPEVRASTYLIVGAVTVVAAAAIVAQRLAIKSRLDEGASSQLPRAAQRFATLTIVVSLAIAAVVAVVVFASNFGGQLGGDIGVRFLSTYLPILLYTAVIVSVLLVGFVFRRETLPKPTADNPLPASDSDGAPLGSPRALAGAFAVPIIAGAVALIFGLIVFDLTQTRLDMWVWVIIHTLIAFGIMAGTSFAARAEASAADDSRARVTRSAKLFNFVVSLVVIAVVLVTAFVQGSSAVTGLRVSPQLSVDIFPGQTLATADLIVSANGWDLEPGSALRVMVVESGETLISGNASTLRDFYEQVSLPAATAPGAYTLEASATGVDGGKLVRTVEFTIERDGTLDVDSVRPDRQQETAATVLPPTASWFVQFPAPALVLLLIGLVTTFVTTVARNREPQGKAAV